VTTRKPTPQQLRATAYHEAGHAVANIRHGIKIKSATIVPGDGYAGMVEAERFGLANPDAIVDDGRWRLWRQRGEALITVMLSGSLAQTRHRKSSVRGYHAHGDRQLAISIAEKIAGFGKVLDAYLAWRWAVADAFVESCWKDIEAVAEALLQNETLDQAGVRAAIDRAHGISFDANGRMLINGEPVSLGNVVS
jgi:hypothetical protein